MGKCYYLTHPNVEIDPAVPVPDWDLSDVGRQRMQEGLRQSWLIDVDHVISSREKKAIETGQIIAGHLGVDMEIVEGLHENDRSSTGFVPPEKFEEIANEFFARPAVSVQGWERALDAQTRIVSEIKKVFEAIPQDDVVLFSGHGGVGTLLKCHLANLAISRDHDVPAGGGYWFCFDRKDLDACAASIDALQWHAFEPQVAEVAS
ncbi:histidine phosphatase family protein [Rhodobacteraceae bacterium RKSG542]|uniref:histidine phosphatase family protein n=1 Tax=Pseudovibrio flavus TaxID=2529854 RepID=UPI0012BD69E8|nr:histidine phosphatase family protein [Pseudovibrio flavus]MTI17848.1 histidine phosphatase family protein [Pseudovibrio flavus]